MHTFIKNAHLIDAETDFVGDLWLKDGRIHALGENLTADFEKATATCPEAKLTMIDAEGDVVMPAFVDLHVHFREPGMTEKEDIKTGSRSALRGGYCAANMMANTDPVIDSAEKYRHSERLIKEKGEIWLTQTVAATKNLDGQEFVDFASLPDSVRNISDDGKGLQNNLMTYQLMQQIKAHDLTLMIHEEDRELSPIDYRLAEDVGTIRDVYLAGKVGTRVHFCHVSTVDSLNAIAAGKLNGYPITCEVTPHHIYLSDSDYAVHPPIRSAEDVQAMVEGVINGTVDCLATDHAPHTPADKEQGAPGMVGLEQAFQIAYRVLVKENGQPLSLLARVLSARPAEILGLKKGRLEPGYDGDVVRIDLEAEETVTADSFASKSANSPFIGEEFETKVRQTLIGGVVKYDSEGENGE